MIFNMNAGEGKKLPVLNSSYPKNVTVTAGNSVTFAVLIAEDGKPAAYTYQWYVNGGVVSGAKSQNYVRDTTNDKGVLTVYCEVTNKAGTVTSRTASVVVQHRLTVNSNAGAAITATNSGNTVTGTCDSSGVATLTLTDGTWTVKATSSSVTASTTVTVDSHKSITLIPNKIPAFTYTGSYQIVNDGDSAISGSDGNWRIKFLTSGTLKFTQLNGASSGIDVFCVGGGGGGGAAYGREISGEGYFASGGGGGGGGYTKTTKGVSVTAGTSYAIKVGAGGSAGNAGGTTSAFGVSASGGSAGNPATYANQPGSGGAGGSNGGTGGNYNTTSSVTPGTNGSPGQGSTTTAFATGSGTKYSGGGGGGQGRNAYGNVYSANVAGGADTGAASHTSAAANGGGGGGGGSHLADNGTDLRAPGSGGSGIVIIRNKR